MIKKQFLFYSVEVSKTNETYTKTANDEFVYYTKPQKSE